MDTSKFSVLGFLFHGALGLSVQAADTLSGRAVPPVLVGLGHVGFSLHLGYSSNQLPAPTPNRVAVGLTGPVWAVLELCAVHLSSVPWCPAQDCSRAGLGLPCVSKKRKQDHCPTQAAKQQATGKALSSTLAWSPLSTSHIYISEPQFPLP